MNHNAITGISLKGAGGATVDGNTVEDNSATGNVVAFGIFADTGAGVNTFKKNRSNWNGINGYFDTGGFGLTNIYTDNQCNFNMSGGSFPAGLCSP